jgi:hypothetical protein
MSFVLVRVIRKEWHFAFTCWWVKAWVNWWGKILLKIMWWNKIYKAIKNIMQATISLINQRRTQSQTQGGSNKAKTPERPQYLKGPSSIFCSRDWEWMASYSWTFDHDHSTDSAATSVIMKWSADCCWCCWWVAVVDCNACGDQSLESNRERVFREKILHEKPFYAEGEKRGTNLFWLLLMTLPSWPIRLAFVIKSPIE